MILRTELKTRPSAQSIGLHDPVFLTGSCFSENIGKKLQQNKFKVLVNPFGTLYNPWSVFEGIRKSIRGETELSDKKIIASQGIYRYLDFHSAISHTTQKGLREQAAAVIHDARQFLSGAGWLILTFGTAIVYKYKETGDISANCHKLPADRFIRQFMSVQEITDEFEKLFRLISEFNPNLRIILTISPVRHLKEGFEDNQLSKSILTMAVSKIVSAYDRVMYFPAYEIMIDDLRDYRFYNRDLVHPNDIAIDYIWEKFCEQYMDEQTLAFMKEWSKIVAAIRHRPFHPESEEYKQFVRQTVDKLNAVKDRVDVEEEIRKLTGAL